MATFCNSNSKSSAARVHAKTLQLHGLQPARLLCPWDSPGNSTGVGGYALLQGIFPIQEWNPCLLHCKQIPYPLSHRRSLTAWKGLFIKTSIPAHLVRAGWLGQPILTHQGLTVAENGTCCAGHVQGAGAQSWGSGWTCGCRSGWFSNHFIWPTSGKQFPTYLLLVRGAQGSRTGGVVGGDSARCSRSLYTSCCWEDAQNEGQGHGPSRSGCLSVQVLLWGAQRPLWSGDRLGVLCDDPCVLSSPQTGPSPGRGQPMWAHALGGVC